MEITKLVIHELIKNAGTTTATVVPSDNLLSNTDRLSLELIERLNGSYSKEGPLYAVFGDDKANQFPRLFDKYFISRNDNSFLEFSKIALENLKEQIKNIPQAKGGYFVFCEYKINGFIFYAIFLIRNTEGVLFNRDTDRNTFVINHITYLNTDKLAMACRVNYEKYSSKEGKYLTFIKHNLPDISDYFVKWVSANEQESCADYTRTLFNLTAQLNRPIQEGVEISIDSYRKNIFDFINASPGKIINLHTMSEHFYEDRDYIMNFIEEKGIEINTEFKADTRTLRRFIRIEVNKDGIQLKFTRGELDTKVRFDPDSPDLVIIESRNFADALRKEIESSNEEE